MGGDQISAQDDRAAMIERFSPISTAFLNLQRSVIGWNVSDYSVMKLTDQELSDISKKIDQASELLSFAKRRDVSLPELKRRLNGR